MFRLLVALFSVFFCAFLYFYTLPKYDFKGDSIDGAVNLSSFNGENKIVFFGFTMCPDVCPTTLNLLSSVINDTGAKVKIIFISLDPNRDNALESDKFVKFFYPNSTAVILDDEELKRVAKNYGVKYQKIELKDSFMKYSIAHSSSLYFFDKEGKFMGEISNLTYENVKNSILNLVKN